MLFRSSQENGAITVEQNNRSWQGYNINVGNPHAVVFINALEEVGELKNAPRVLPASAYPEGVNVEFVQVQTNGELSMRVHERGSGETRSCGTGVCAVALAAAVHLKKPLPTTFVIHPPGGRLEVELDPHSNAILTGPAVLISEHDLSPYLG